jgi:energy-coupling factor transporter ATP-binding protein EcfA2
MSKASLTSIKIEGLRGASRPVELFFEKGKKLTIIYGENGTGKSTICDALDFLGNGKVGSLDTRGLGSAIHKYWPTVGKSASDVRVTLKTTAGDCIASLDKSNVNVSNAGLRPSIEVLRRTQILKLVEAKPGERYQAISRFVDVAAAEASENTLRKLVKDTEDNEKVIVARVSENKQTIESFWDRAGKPPTTDVVNWAETMVAQDRSGLADRKASLDKLIAKWDALLSHPAAIDAKRGAHGQSEAVLGEANAKLGKLKESVATDYLEVLDLLKAAQAHLISHPDPSVCPLCGSAERAHGLASEVERRIASQSAYGQLEAAQRAISEKESAVRSAKQRLDDAVETARVDAQKLSELFTADELPVDIAVPETAIPTDTALWADWLNQNQTLRNGWASESTSLAEDARFIGTLKDALTAYKQNAQAAGEHEETLPHLRKMLAIVEGQRKQFIDSVLADIAKRVGELYDMVHPGEGLNKISLGLDEARRASLDITTEFGGKVDTPPQAYFSDSHLDTLGLCVFLALAERDAPEQKILVLDDVLGSVDEPHVDRVIEMVYDVTAKFRHCVVTTHYGPWRHKLKWGWLKNGQCQFVELRRWSLGDGIAHTRSLPETTRLRDMVKAQDPDLQGICAKAGVVLEAILDFLTMTYECSVPRRVGSNYTLGDLLPAIDGKLRKALRVEHLQEDEHGQATYTTFALDSHLNKLMQIAQVRNVFGCHFNQISFELLDSDALGFGAEVLALADAVIDQDAGWPRNSKSGSYWATTGETRRLHPLRKPS